MTPPSLAASSSSTFFLAWDDLVRAGCFLAVGLLSLDSSLALGALALTIVRGLDGAFFTALYSFFSSSDSSSSDFSSSFDEDDDSPPSFSITSSTAILNALLNLV